DIVWHLRDQDNVVIAKGEPGILDLATQPLNGGANSFNSILRMGEQGLPAFPRVRDLVKKTWHTTSLRNSLPFSEPRHSTPARRFRTLTKRIFHRWLGEYLDAGAGERMKASAISPLSPSTLRGTSDRPGDIDALPFLASAAGSGGW